MPSTRLLIVFLCISFLFSCKQKTSEVNNQEINLSLNTFWWLQGAWDGGEYPDRYFQYWNVGSDSIIIGENLIVVQNDTLFYQDVKIIKRGSTIVYKTRPKWIYEQPYTYRIKVNKNGEHVFEDTSLEFPQRIVIALNEDGSLYYRLEGTINGQAAYEDFTLYKPE